MYVTYRFQDSTRFVSTADTLHCNYYQKIQGPTGSTQDSQNVTVRFGAEFPYLIQGGLNGFSATDFQLIFQKVTGDTKPSPTGWKIYDYTSDLTSTMVNGYITENGLTGTTFIITKEIYETLSSTYNLGDYVAIPENGQSQLLNFGDEYFFYLYDENKDLIVISKLQSPEIRQGIQQYVVKLDF